MLHFTSVYGHVWTVPYPLTKAFEVQNGHGSAQMAHWETQNLVGQMLNHCHYQTLKIVKALEKDHVSRIIQISSLVNDIHPFPKWCCPFFDAKTPPGWFRKWPAALHLLAKAEAQLVELSGMALSAAVNACSLAQTAVDLRLVSDFLLGKFCISTLE